MHYDTVLILDFGSQYTQLIGRVIRSINVYCEIHPYHLTETRIKQINPKAIILSGSPFSINQEDAPQPDSSIWEMNIPILGICYGMQLIVSHFRGKVQHQTKREYGQAILQIKKSHPLLEGLALEEKVWMSHGDTISELPPEFIVLASTSSAPYAVIAHKNLPIFGLQFHPEVVHTPNGKTILQNFVLKVAKCSANWTPSNFLRNP